MLCVVYDVRKCFCLEVAFKNTNGYIYSDSVVLRCDGKFVRSSKLFLFLLKYLWPIA